MNKTRITGSLMLMLMSTTMMAQNVEFTDHQENIVYPNQTDTTRLQKKYKEIEFPTPNYDEEKTNDVQGVILHHTAEPTAKRSLEILTSPIRKVSTHAVIDTDGTRYILAEPTVVTYHAGYSTLNGRDACNEFTIGIEFQGNTLVEPLTEAQIESAIEYLKPIIAKYHIPLTNIVTHEMVRKNYKRKYPNKRVSGKVDITQQEYSRFMEAISKHIKPSDTEITE